MIHEECDDGFFAALDCIGEESDEYWDVMAEQKIKNGRLTPLTMGDNGLLLRL